MNLRERLPSIAFDRPVSVLMLFVALLVVGAIAWVRIPVQMMPGGFDPGFLYVWIPYNNASPLEVDEQIVTTVQDQLSTVGGISSMRTRASQGSAGVGLEFYASTDMDEAYNAVADRLERSMPDLPDDVERYWIWRYNPNDQPVIWAGVQLPEAMEDPYHVMTQVVQPRLERIPGVASLDVWGVPRRGIYIDYDKERVYAHGVDLGGLQGRLATDNFQMSGGQILHEGRIRQARSLSPITGVEDLRAFPVKEGVRLGDIADVQMRAALSASLSRVNGEEAAALAIRKESSANAVEVTARVREVFAELADDPRVEGARFFVFFSQGDLIEDSIDTLTDTAITGGLFALLILWVFLREVRMTLLIAASIPFSLMITVGMLYFQGQSLNLLSLMGLMLAVGMVVDNAIVVVETIYRHRADGLSARDAAVKGTAEVNLAILLSTMTTMVVFLPVILMSENARFGFFMGVLGMPVVYALAASLVVALLFAPLATRYMGNAQIKPDPRWLVALSERYARTLGWITRHRVDAGVALMAMGLLTVTVAMPGVQCTGGEDENLNDFVIRFTVPPQADVYDRDDILREIEQTVEAHRAEWGVRVYRSQLGADDMEGRLNVYLEDDGPMARDAVMEAAREALPDDLPGVTTSVGWEGSTDAGTGGNQLSLRVYGEDMDTLFGLAEEVGRRVESVEGVLNVHLDVQNDGTQEVRLRIDRDAVARYGVSAAQVGRLVAYAMRGGSLPDLRDGEKEIPIAFRYSLEDRTGLEKLLDFDVWSPVTMSLVPVSALTHVEYGRGPTNIRREGRQTSTSITLDLDEEANARDLFPKLDAALSDMAFPRGYGWSQGQKFRGQQEEDAAMGLALLLSVVFVYLLIGVLFESWILPISIVTTIPMAMMGALWGLYLSGTPMDTMAGVGLVILVGVVVNNGIVLVDLITQLRSEGMPREDALVEAGRRRLRPILMTALTTICGLLPMALGSSSFIGIPYAPLGRTVIGGLLAATLLTLLFVPYLYSLLDDLRAGAGTWLATVRDPQ